MENEILIVVLKEDMRAMETIEVIKKMREMAGVKKVVTIEALFQKVEEELS